MKPLSWRHINLCNDNEEWQLQGYHNVQMLVGHRNNAGIRTHLFLKTTRLVQTGFKIVLGCFQLLRENIWTNIYKNMNDWRLENEGVTDFKAKSHLL